jgi:hypothetical protein
MNTNENNYNLNEFFSTLGIEQIVCIDDQYRERSEETLNELIGIGTANGTEKFEELTGKIPQLKEIAFDDKDIWQMQFTKLWKELTEKDKRIIHSHLVENENTNDSQKDEESAENLKDLLHGSSQIPYQELSLSQWKAREAEYLEEENIGRTLFLIDRDLSYEGGRTDEGIYIIKKLLAESEEAACGLLSHTFEADNEVDRWEALSKKHDLDKYRFVLTSKSRLRNTKVESFFQNLKLTVLNKHCKKLKEKVSDLISETNDKSRQEIEKLSIYDFEHIVFRSSYSEGIWEPDTLFRLYGMFQRDVFRQKAKTDEYLQELTNKIRGISLLPLSHHSDSPDTSWKIRRLELYENGSHINALHMPLELGDIFEKPGETNEGRKFILLAQPCDLMVRSDKKGKRKPDMYEAILAEIEKPMARHKKKECQYLFYELPYFDKNTGETHYVNFNRIHTVPLCHLDLCVYQPDGSAKISTEQTCPNMVIPMWKDHFTHLKKDFGKTVTRYNEYKEFLEKKSVKDEIKKEMKKGILSLVLPKSSNSKKALFKGKIQPTKNGGSLEFNFRRAGRFRQPGAGDMLMKFAHKMSRMAFEHDFGRNTKD